MITDTTDHGGRRADSLQGHPLDPVSGAEYMAGRQIMAAAGLLTESVRFAYYGLDEPHKKDVKRMLHMLPSDALLPGPDGRGLL